MIKRDKTTHELVEDSISLFEMDPQQRKEALDSAFVRSLSPCEWTWTKDQQELMARYCLWAAQRLGVINELTGLAP